MGKYRVLGALFDRVYRNDLNSNFNDVDTDIKEQKKRVDDLIVANPQPSEVQDARGGFTVLRDRLNDTDAQLAEIPTNVNNYPGTTFTEKFKAAITTIKSGGKPRVLKLPSGTLAINEQITIDSNIILEGEGIGNTILDFSSANGAFPEGYGIYAKGSDLVSLPSLASSIAKNTKTINFSAPHGLASGDLVVIYDNVDNSFSSFRTYYKAGEIVRVKSVSGNDITIDNATFAGYASTVALYKMNPITVEFKNFSIKAKTGTTGISIKHGYKCKYENLFGSGTEIAHFNFMKCFNSQAQNVNVAEYSVSSGFGYGLSISNSQNIKVSDSELTTSRHGLTIGGSDEIGCVPNRNIRIINSVIGGFGTTELGADVHGNSEYVDFENCTLLNGILLRGDHISVKDSRIRTTSEGLAVYGDELLGADILIQNNDIEQTANTPFYGVIYIPLTDKLTRNNGNIKVLENRIQMGEYNGFPINIYNISSVATIDVTVKENEVSCFATSVANGYLLVRAAGGKAIKRVNISGNKLVNLSIWARDCNAEVYHIEENKLHGSFSDGVIVTANATPIPTSELINICRNSVIKALNAGMQVTGLSQTFTLVRAIDNVSINSNQAKSTSGVFGVSLYITKANSLLLSDNTVGDNQAAPTQINLYSLTNITNVFEKNNMNVGSVSGIYKTGISNYMKGSELFGSIAWNPNALTTGTGETSPNITVTGAKLGDYVIVSPPYDMEGLTYSGYVQSQDIVRIRIHNDTGTSIDIPAGGTWRVLVVKSQ